MTSTTKTYKVLLIGDGGVGKTSLIAKARNGSFEKLYVPTMGVEVSPLLMGDMGETILKVWDLAGQEKFGGLRDGYYVKADAVIFVYDGTNQLSQKNLRSWVQDVSRVCGDIPCVIVRNKVDAGPQKGETLKDEFSVSCRTGDGVLAPFEDIVEKLAALS